MSRRQPAEDGLLFDLPLDREPAEGPVGAAPSPVEEEAERAEQPPLPLDGEPPGGGPGVEGTAGGHGEVDEDAADEVPVVAAPVEKRGRWLRRESRRPSLRLRAVAGLTDLGACAAVLVLLLVALLAQGIRPGLADWPAAAVFLLAFSFLYSVLPLAFWGRTPGMALAGLKATGRDGRPMTFRQAALKWLGSVLTVGLAGLPVLLALGGRRSLSDLTGGTRTLRTGSPG